MAFTDGNQKEERIPSLLISPQIGSSTWKPMTSRVMKQFHLDPSLCQDLGWILSLLLCAHFLSGVGFSQSERAKGRQSGAREAVTGLSASPLMDIQLLHTCTGSIFPHLSLYWILLLMPHHPSHLFFFRSSALVSKLLSNFIETKPFCLTCLKSLWNCRGP